jgi:hypothetical protein
MGGGLGRGAIRWSLAGFKAAPLPARSSRGEGEDLRLVRLSSCALDAWAQLDAVLDFGSGNRAAISPPESARAEWARGARFVTLGSVA